MSDNSLWSGSGARRLGLSGGGGGGGFGGRSVEFLLGGALALIIVGSLVMTIMYGWNDGGSGSRTPVKRLYRCESCTKEFELDRRDGPAGLVGMPIRDPGMAPFKPNCPHCQTENAGISLTRCPNCEKYYLSPMTEYSHGVMLEQVPPGEAPLDICKHCGTDRRQWIRDHRKKRKKK